MKQDEVRQNEEVKQCDGEITPADSRWIIGIGFTNKPSTISWGNFTITLFHFIILLYLIISFHFTIVSLHQLVDLNNLDLLYHPV